MSETILSIEPRLPPAVCGTSMYGWRLTEHWPDQSRRFVHAVVDGAEASRRQFATEDIVETGQSSSGLLAALEKHAGGGAILHYASRGYHRYGIPIWLARGIARWRRRNPVAPLLVFFHEVPQPLPMRSRHYILERINRAIIRLLCRKASVLMTNAPEHAQRLSELSGRASVEWLPVPSNIPAPPDVESTIAGRRRREFVIFGLPFTHLLTVRAFEKELAAWQSAGLIEKVHLIGPNDAKFSPQTAALLRTLLPEDRIVTHGPLEPRAVSALLMSAGFCLTQNTGANFSKSGTFAAFAVHGCAVVARLGAGPEPLAFLVQPEEVADPQMRSDFSEFDRRARALREWYLRASDWPVISAKVRAAFDQCGK